MALSVQILLSMDRPDAAEKAAKAMAALDDDATLSQARLPLRSFLPFSSHLLPHPTLLQLAGAYVSLALGGPKVVEAAYAFQEAGEKHGWTAKLHAGAAACFAAQGAWDEAERCLGEALACDGKDPDVLAGLIVACAQLGRRGGAKAKAYGLQLRAAAPAHPFITRGAAAEAAFEAAAAAITA